MTDQQRAELTVDLLLLVVAILDTGDKDGGLVGEDETALDEVTVTGPQDGVQHGLVEQEVAHPLGDDDVDLGEGENNLLHLALQEGDLVAQAVDLDNLLGLADDGRHVDSDDVLGASLCGEPVGRVSVRGQKERNGECAHGQDAGSAANIEDDLVLEQVTVLVDGVAVAACAHVVLEHLLVDSMVVVAAEPVSLPSVECLIQGESPVEVVLLGVSKTGETVALLRGGCVVLHVCCGWTEMN
jgi:ribosomal protein S11